MLEPRKFGEWLHGEVFRPVLVAIATASCKAWLRQAHGVSSAELFCTGKPVAVAVQSLEKRLDVELLVTVEDAETSQQLPEQQGEALCAAAVESAALEAKKTVLEAPSPWFEEWRQALFRSLRWSDHEGLDQPCAALLVVLSKEADPAILEQLLHSSNMPPLCTQGILDPVPSRVALLLHDVSDPESPSEEVLQRRLEDLRQRFPNPVFHLRINSVRAFQTLLQHCFSVLRLKTAMPRSRRLRKDMR